MDDPLRRDLATACRVLAANGAGDLIWGHASARSSDGRGVWLKQAGYGLEEITPHHVHLVGWDGEVLEGAGTRHSEYGIHVQVMLARRDVNAVVHVHSRHAIALAARGAELRPVSHKANYFAPFGVPRFDQTTDLILTPELGAAVARALGPASGVSLVNHGIVCVGPDLLTAVLAAVLLERASAQQLLTARDSAEFVWTDDEESLRKRDHIYSPAATADAWRYLARTLSPRSNDDVATTWRS
jgi:L-fuculose-phosphate aldolase